MSRITAIDSLSIFHLFASEFIHDYKFIFFSSYISQKMNNL